MAEHHGRERARTPEDCLGLKAQLSSSLPFGLPALQPPSGVLATAPAALGLPGWHDPIVLHNVFLGVLPWGLGDVKSR